MNGVKGEHTQVLTDVLARCAGFFLVLKTKKAPNLNVQPPLEQSVLLHCQQFETLSHLKMLQ